MSHFTVLVPAKDEKDLEARLLPYHEYECTGIEAYLEFVPEDMEELQKRYAEYGGGEDFDQFVKDWCGATKNEQGIYGRMTNPNRRWDWWVVGGRWSGTLMLKPDAYGKGQNGQGGLMSPANADPKRADVALASQVDWEAMRDQQSTERRERYQKWHSLREPEKEGEEVYQNALCNRAFFMLTKDEFADLENMTEDEYVAKYGTAKALTFAYLDLEGKWHERAHMGWFAVTWDEQPDYDAEWWQFVTSLPAEQRLHVVDCHI